MFTQILSSIEGVEIYPIISLLIFIPFFVIVTVKAMRMDKAHAQKMSQLPLENTNSESEIK